MYQVLFTSSRSPMALDSSDNIYASLYWAQTLFKSAYDQVNNQTIKIHIYVLVYEKTYKRLFKTFLPSCPSYPIPTQKVVCWSAYYLLRATGVIKEMPYYGAVSFKKAVIIIPPCSMLDWDNWLCWHLRLCYLWAVEISNRGEPEQLFLLSHH